MSVTLCNWLNLYTMTNLEISHCSVSIWLGQWVDCCNFVQCIYFGKNSMFIMYSFLSRYDRHTNNNNNKTSTWVILDDHVTCFCCMETIGTWYKVYANVFFLYIYNCLAACFCNPIISPLPRLKRLSFHCLIISDTVNVLSHFLNKNTI